MDTIVKRKMEELYESKGMMLFTDKDCETELLGKVEEVYVKYGINLGLMLKDKMITITPENCERFWTMH